MEFVRNVVVFDAADLSGESACWAGMLGATSLFAASFANASADDPIAAEVNRPAKVLVSTTVTEPTWARTTVIAGDVVDGVRAPKEGDGGGILVNGSITLCRTLIDAGLVDELHLMIHPIVVGHGRRLFADNSPQVPLTVATSETFPTGVLSVRFRTWEN